MDCDRCNVACWQTCCDCLYSTLSVPPNRSRGRSGAPGPGLQGDFFYPSLTASQDTHSLEWAKLEGDISWALFKNCIKMLLTVISMWRNLQTARKQRPSCQRLQTISLPIAASQCLNGQLSPCDMDQTQWDPTLPPGHQSLSNWLLQYVCTWELCAQTLLTLVQVE